jgi:hypothetical protein
VDPLGVVRRVAAGQDGIVTLAQAKAAGLTVHEVHRMCRSGRWRRLVRAGYLVDADLLGEAPRRARIRAAVASVGPSAVAVLDTAAELHRVAGLRATDAIHVSVPGRLARPARAAFPEVVVHQLAIEQGQLSEVAGIPCTDAPRTLADLVLRTDRLSSVALLDSALNRGLVTPGSLPVVAALIRGRRGAVAARPRLAEVDGRAQSPLETRVRLRSVDGGMPPDVLQYPVRDRDGYLLAVGDLAWLRARVIGEADGRGPHESPDALFGDRRRQNRIAAAGWRVVRFTWSDTLHPDYIPHVLRSLLPPPHP